MTSFFKKIRRKLLAEGRLKRYLVYAFGEILLVVIGILIAVQINNWNEGRKSEEELITILKTVKQDIESDLKEVKVISEIYQERVNIIDTILHRGADLEYVKNCRQCPGLTSSFIAVSFNYRGYNTLKNRIAGQSVINDSLLLNIDDFYGGLQLTAPLIGDAIEKVTFESLEDMKRHEWIIDFLSGKKRPIEINDYILNDKEHRSNSRFSEK